MVFLSDAMFTQYPITDNHTHTSITHGVKIDNNTKTAINLKAINLHSFKKMEFPWPKWFYDHLENTLVNPSIEI